MRKSALPLFLLFALFLTYVVYRPGLTGAFIFDDYNNFVKNTHLGITNLNFDTLWQASRSGSSGLLMRPISMASFALNIYATGLDPLYLKLTNILIHLLNGIGIFVFTVLLLNVYRKRFQPELSVSYTRWLSLIIATAWLLHPLNLTSVLYVVQRMTSLAAFFTIWGLTLYVWGRARLYEGNNGGVLMLASLLLFTPLAVLSKENGMLLPVFMLIIEFTLFGFMAQKHLARCFVAVFFIIGVAIPVSIALGWIVVHPEWILNGYKSRGFTLLERLMTEPRVIWDYIQQIIVPSAVKMGLYQDDIVISHGLFQPFTTILSVLGLAALMVISFMLRRQAPLITLGLLFFLVGHSIESTLIPLEIAFEHRNYLPMYGLLLIFFFYLLYPLNYIKHLRLRQTGALLLIGLFAFNTYARASAWANPFDLAKIEVDHHPNSVRANTDMADIYDRMIAKTPEGKELNYRLARYYYERTVALDGNNTYGLLSLMILSSTNGKPVEDFWPKELKRRLEYAPQSPIIGSRLVFLVKCQDSGTCKFQKDELEGILQAPLTNPTLTPLNQGEVRYAWAVYLVNIAHDYVTARKVMYDMAAVSGDPQHRLTLIKFLIALRDFEAAREQLRLLKQSGYRQIFNEEISTQEKALSEYPMHAADR